MPPNPSHPVIPRPFRVCPRQLATLAATFLAFPGLCADSPPTTEDLLRQVQELDQKLKVLQRQQELNEEAAAEKANGAIRVSLDSGGLAVRSADSNFVFRLRGYAQVAARGYPGGTPGTLMYDTFYMARVRPIIEGTVYKMFDYRVMLDFGSQQSISTANNALLQDAYVTARLWPEFQLLAGKMKEPVGLERLQSGANLLFITRGYPTQLVPNRDVGFAAQGELFGRSLSYAVGAFNGVADGGSGDYEVSDSAKNLAARLFAHPFGQTGLDPLLNLGLGVAGTYGDFDGVPRPYVSPGMERIFSYRAGAGTNAATANVVGDGAQWRFTPQGYYYWGSFGLFGEYVIASQELASTAGAVTSRSTLQNTAWQVAVSYFLTGEENGWKPVAPLKPFKLKDEGWGAVELAARVQQIRFDDESFPVYANPQNSVDQATSFGLGINWYLNRNIKLTLNYDYTDFDATSGAYAGAHENVVSGQVQFSW